MTVSAPAIVVAPCPPRAAQMHMFTLAVVTLPVYVIRNAG